MSHFVDREQEQEELRGLLQRNTRQLALLYGRRRLGKTHLLAHVLPGAETFYWTAAATTSAQNREQLVRDVASWTGGELDSKDYPTWRTVFRLLLELTRAKAIVLDEFQYLGEDPKELAGI